jgi:hypothetical protein
LRRIGIAFVATLLSASMALAQHVTDTSRNATVHRAKTKVRVGLILLGAGALMIPVTATGSPGSHGATTTAGFGMATVGGALVWAGVEQQRQAPQPAKAFTLAVGLRRSAAVSWNWWR